MIETKEIDFKKSFKKRNLCENIMAYNKKLVKDVFNTTHIKTYALFQCN